MRARITKSILVFGLCAPAVLLGPQAFAFKTYTSFGGAIHEEITKAALVTGGPKIAEECFKQIDAGNTGQDDPSSAAFTTASHHFDDNQLKDSVQYVEDCYTEIRARVCNADKDSNDWTFVLNKFGELLHTVQDFYSHSNYVELQLKANGNLLPAQIPIVSNWNSLPSGVRTGFFYYAGLSDNEAVLQSGFSLPTSDPNRDTFIGKLPQQSGAKYATNAEYSKIKNYDQRLNYVNNLKYTLIHRDVNKDNGATEEGSAINPVTKRNLYAYARSAAIKETERQWQRLETEVKKNCPLRANDIIDALKHGLKGLTGIWGFGTGNSNNTIAGGLKANAPKFAALRIKQQGNLIKLVKLGSGNNDITFDGTLQGKVIQGKWSYPQNVGWSGTFEITVDDDNHIHGWMLRTMDHGQKVNCAKEDFHAVRRKKTAHPVGDGTGLYTD